MNTGLTGAIKESRLGSVVVNQSILLNFNTYASGVNTKLCTIPGTPAKPILFRTPRIIIVTPNNGTTSSGNVGSSAGGTQFVVASDLKSAAGTTTGSSLNLNVATSDVEIWFNHIDTGVPTAGQFIVNVEILGDVNPQVAGA